MARITRENEEEWEVPAPEPFTIPEVVPDPTPVPSEPSEVPA